MASPGIARFLSDYLSLPLGVCMLYSRSTSTPIVAFWPAFGRRRFRLMLTTKSSGEPPLKGRLFVPILLLGQMVDRRCCNMKIL